jgi:hypothetical protein
MSSDEWRLEVEDVANALYAIEINQQSLGRTEENGQRLREAQKRLVVLLKGQGASHPLIVYIHQLQEKYATLREWAEQMPDAGIAVDDPRLQWWYDRPKDQNRG